MGKLVTVGVLCLGVGLGFIIMAGIYLQRHSVPGGYRHEV